jgi:hypothetical protein
MLDVHVALQGLNGACDKIVQLETQKTGNSQGNTEQKKQHWRYQDTQLQTILCSHRNKNNRVLTQKQT